MNHHVDKNFWLDRWKKNQLGFNQDKPNSTLVELLPQFSIPKNGSVFVPLCGKSVDMIWLSKQGFEVVGIELSPLAIQAFFEENKIPFQKNSLGPFVKWSAIDQPITILEGDIFLFKAHYLDKIETTNHSFFHFIYDRASLIALPSNMRKEYYCLYEELVSRETKCLLLTIEYTNEEFQGPPFSVMEEEIRNFLGGSFQLSLLIDKKVRALSPRFLKSGLEEIGEKAYKIEWSS